MGGKAERKPKVNSIEQNDFSESLTADDIVSLCLKGMSRVPILKPEQEVELARRLERGRQACRRLAEGTCSPEEKERLEKEVAAGDEARRHLIEANTRLVISVAKRYIGQGMPFLDLVQEGSIGLMRAVEKFDHRRGHRFSTYATWWIRQAINRALADQGRSIRLPAHMAERVRAFHAIRGRLEKELGRRPTEEEIAQEMGLRPHQLRRVIQASRELISLEQPIGVEGESELGDFVENEEVLNPHEEVSRLLLVEEIETLLSELSPREARILRMRFGLIDGKEYTLEELGHKFGLTRERIRQIEKEALRKLRHPSRTRQLKDYMI